MKKVKKLLHKLIMKLLIAILVVLLSLLILYDYWVDDIRKAYLIGLCALLSVAIIPITPNVKRDKRRKFDDRQKTEIWARQRGYCAECGKKMDKRATHFDHKKQWAKGGKTSISNGQALCSNCHSVKSHYENKYGRYRGK